MVVQSFASSSEITGNLGGTPKRVHYELREIGMCQAPTSVSLDRISFMTNTSVRIWGFAADGKTFTQKASFRSLSRKGAWIEGVARMIQPGEIIGLQYEANKARVRVSYVDSRQEHNVVLAVDLVGGHPCPWERLVDLSRADLAPANRRQYPRQKLALPVELRTREGVPVRVTATDACGNGCYLQTMATVCVGTQFAASFSIGDRRIVCECTVRTCDPGLGMGVEFTGLDSNPRRDLQTWLEEHFSTAQSPAHHNDPALV